MQETLRAKTSPQEQDLQMTQPLALLDQGSKTVFLDSFQGLVETVGGILESVGNLSRDLEFLKRGGKVVPLERDTERERGGERASPEKRACLGDKEQRATVKVSLEMEGVTAEMNTLM